MWTASRNDLVTPLPDAPQTGQPDSRKARGKMESLLLVVRMRGIRTALVIAAMGCWTRVSSVMTGATKAATAARRPARSSQAGAAPGRPAVCARTVCGNGILEAGEVCDCGTDPTKLPTGCTGPNGLFNGDGTGCSKTCTKEPSLRGTNGTGATHACTPTCGNGNLESGEGCDDGNW